MRVHVKGREAKVSRVGEIGGIIRVGADLRVVNPGVYACLGPVHLYPELAGGCGVRALPAPYLAVPVYVQRHPSGFSNEYLISPINGAAGARLPEIASRPPVVQAGVGHGLYPGQVKGNDEVLESEIAQGNLRACKGIQPVVHKVRAARADPSGASVSAFHVVEQVPVTVGDRVGPVPRGYRVSAGRA